MMNTGREMEVSNSLPEARSGDGGRGREWMYNGHGGGVGPEVIDALRRCGFCVGIFELGLQIGRTVGGIITVAACLGA